MVVDADGTILGKYRKHHIPHLDRFWEKFYFRPGNLGYPVFETAVGPVGVYICYDRHFPEGWRELGLNGAQIVFNPNATKPGLSNRLWEIEQPAAAAANGYFVLQPNRVGREDNEYGELAVDFYGSSQFIDPRGNFVGERGSGSDEEVVIRDLDLDMVQADARRLAVLPRPPARLLHVDRRSRDLDARSRHSIPTGGSDGNHTDQGRHGRHRHRAARRPTCWSTARPSPPCWRRARRCSASTSRAPSTRSSTRPAST